MADNFIYADIGFAILHNSQDDASPSIVLDAQATPRVQSNCVNSCSIFWSTWFYYFRSGAYVYWLYVLSRLTHVHFITIFIWIFYRSLQTCLGHSGYDLCFDPGNLLPFAIGADHHDFHHAQNCGNYGSLFMFWDALFGTQKDYIEWLKKDVENKNKIKD